MKWPYKLLAVASLGVGCSSGVTLETDRGSYQAGSQLSLKLSSSEPRIGYSLCAAVAELHLADGTWQESKLLAPPSLAFQQVCDASLQNLIGPDSVHRDQNLSSTAEAGLYRFRLAVERSGVWTEVTSNTFKILSSKPTTP